MTYHGQRPFMDSQSRSLVLTTQVVHKVLFIILRQYYPDSAYLAFQNSAFNGTGFLGAIKVLKAKCRLNICLEPHADSTIGLDYQVYMV